ncbi:hypothetical protein BaRGS_00035958 [Batillaria attramentaria]|uniref:Uncharacterized protein n=1 Tax=Batillaria attramentaria TaxID=370345 RepID=A0ABD0JD39_9CAEN
MEDRERYVAPPEWSLRDWRDRHESVCGGGSRELETVYCVMASLFVELPCSTCSRIIHAPAHDKHKDNTLWKTLRTARWKGT